MIDNMIDKMSYVGGILAFCWGILIVLIVPIYIGANWKRSSKTPMPPEAERRFKKTLIRVVKEDVDDTTTKHGDMYDET